MTLMHNFRAIVSAMSHARFAPLPAAVLLFWAAPALSAPLPEALRIQLGTKGSVSVGAALTGSTVAAKIREATQALASMDASLAVWVERRS